MNFFVSILLWSVSQALAQSETNQTLNETNMCRQMEEYPVEVVVTEKVLYQQRYSEWCWQVPPRCSKYKSAYKTEIKVQKLMKTRMVEKCCFGYETFDNGTICQPVCSKGCGNGYCINPEKCQCADGSDSCSGSHELPEIKSNAIELSSTKVATKLNGPNVCIDYKEFPIDVKVNEHQTYQELESEWCLKFPPRCSVPHNKTRIVPKTVTVLEIRPMKICCEGYQPNSAWTECVKIKHN
jgi:EMI domain